MFLLVVDRQQRQLVRQNRKTFLLRENTNGNQVGKKSQVDTKLARIWNLPLKIDLTSVIYYDWTKNSRINLTRLVNTLITLSSFLVSKTLSQFSMNDAEKSP